MIKDKWAVIKRKIHTSRNCGLGAGTAVSEPQGVLTTVSKLVQHWDWIRQWNMRGKKNFIYIAHSYKENIKTV